MPLFDAACLNLALQRCLGTFETFQADLFPRCVLMVTTLPLFSKENLNQRAPVDARHQGCHSHAKLDGILPCRLVVGRPAGRGAESLLGCD